jgi:peptidoglycan/LPS O-acetylase OafA/YrhL
LNIEDKRRIDIQILRGIAVIAIVLFHLNKDFFPFGFLGVDVFFVVSGFVVTPLILDIFKDPNKEKWKTSLKSFYRKRFFRLAPALLITILITAILSLILAPVFDVSNIGLMGFAAIFFLGNYGAYKLQGDYFAQTQNPLIHTWSLSVEEQLYIFIPIFFFILFGLFKPGVKIFFLSFMLFFIVSILSAFPLDSIRNLIRAAGFADYEMFAFYSPISRLWQFSIGAILAISSLQKTKQIVINSRWLSNILIIMLLMILFQPINFQTQTFLPSLFATLITSLIIHFRSIDQLKYKMSFIKWVGDRSYSVYLVHMPVAYSLSRVEKQTSIFLNSLFIIVSFFTILCIGNLSFKYIENKYRYTNIILKPPKIFTRITIMIIFNFVLLGVMFFRQPLGLEMNNDTKCKVWVADIDLLDAKLFDACFTEHGKSLIVLGDSHAMNFYNSLFYSSNLNFMVGVSGGGCRIYEKNSPCSFIDFFEFVKENPTKINEVLYHQSGSYLISDLNGQVDTDSAFKVFSEFKIVRDDINSIIEYLQDLNQYVSVRWVGPFVEARVKPSLFDIYTKKSEINSLVSYNFAELDLQISKIIKSLNSDLIYIPINDIKSISERVIRVEGCIRFRDTDHWSACAEKKYSSDLLVHLFGK